MTRKVVRIEKCLRCGDETEYIVRDDNVNSGITDNDIRIMMLSEVEETSKFKECTGCWLETRHMVVGWRGTID